MTSFDERVTLCAIDELADGEARGFDPYGTGRDALFVVRRGEKLFAYRNVCPHQGASMPWRKNAYLNGAATRIVCSAHGAQFEIETGKCMLGAALGRALKPIAIEVDADGKVQARISKEL
ncbi:MAG: Rieske (2Fe-2S) protein [Lysobacterales bacterium]